MKLHRPTYAVVFVGKKTPGAQEVMVINIFPLLALQHVKKIVGTRHHKKTSGAHTQDSNDHQIIGLHRPSKGWMAN